VETPKAAIQPPRLVGKALDPKSVRLFCDPHNRLRAEFEGKQTFLDVQIVRTFPLTEPNRYIGILVGRIEDLGVIVEPMELDDESYKIVQAELTRRYFTTIVHRIESMREEFGATYWTVETDRGRREFVVRHMRDNAHYLSATRLLITDVDGNRFEVPDMSKLDSESYDLLSRVA